MRALAIVSPQGQPGEPSVAAETNLEPALSFLLSFSFFFKIFNLFTTERGGGAETQAEGQAGSFREADVGLDPGSPGSLPGAESSAKPLGHQGCPNQLFLWAKCSREHLSS